MRRLAIITLVALAASGDARAQGVPTLGPSGAGSSYGSPLTSLSLTAIAISSGDEVVVFQQTGPGPYASVPTDSASILSCSFLPGTYQSFNGNFQLEAAICSASGSSASDTITLHFSTDSYVSGTAWDIGRTMAGSWVLDYAAYSTAASSTTACPSPSFTTYSASEAIIVACGTDHSGSTLSAGTIGGSAATLGAQAPNGGTPNQGRLGMEGYVPTTTLMNATAMLTYTPSVATLGTIVISLSTVPLIPPSLTVNAGTVNHTISPYIYSQGGIPPDTTLPDSTFAKKANLALIRFGGDAATNYSYTNDSYNAGNDGFFSGGFNGTPTASAQFDNVISTFRGINSDIQFLDTIPINPWLTKAALLCSFTVASYLGSPAYGPQTQTNTGSWGGNPASNCGDSISTTTGQLTDTDITYNYYSNTTTEQENWITHLQSTWGTCASGTGVCFYQLDNEPSGWSNTHKDWQTTTPATYATIVSDGETYASAIRAKDSTAGIIGPSDYTGVWFTTTAGTGGVQAVQYYLQSFKAYDTANGIQTLTAIDEHYQVGDNGTGGLSPGDGGKGIQYDFDQVRSWWDSTYNYSGAGYQGGPLEFIPRMQGFIAFYYPGLSFDCSEFEVSHYTNGSWPLVGGSSVIDALVMTDFLGVAGSYNMGLATLFDRVASTDAEAFAYYLYRNYDNSATPGATDAFGTQSVTAASTNPTKLSVYCAKRPGDGKLTCIIVNKESLSYATTLGISGFTPSATADVYTYSSANIGALVHTTASTGGGTISYTFPAYSATEFVIAPGATPTPPAPPTGSGQR